MTEDRPEPDAEAHEGHSGFCLTHGFFECRDLADLRAKLSAAEEAKAQAERQRDEAKKQYKVLCEAVNCGSQTCDDKPGNTCNSYGHDEDCPYVEDAITLMRLAGDLKVSQALVNTLVEALQFAVDHMDTVSGGTLYAQCSTCEYDDGVGAHAPGCPSTDWYKKATGVLQKAREAGYR